MGGERWGEVLVDLLFPGEHLCVFCSAAVRGQKPKAVCATCGEKILERHREGQACDVCGFFCGPQDCPNCIDWGRELARVMSVVPYEGIYRELMQQLKYGGRTELALPLGRLMAQRLSLSGLVKALQVIIPIPLYCEREAERGFNQSELLGRVVSRWHHLPFVTDAVSRRFYHKPQASQGRHARRLCMEGAFEVINKQCISGKRILVVDDMITTGATLTACADVLKRAGAKEVYGLTWSAGVPKNI